MDTDAIKKRLADGTDKGIKALDAFLEDDDQQRRAEVFITNAVLSFIMRRDTVRSVRAINEIRAGRPITKKDVKHIMNAAECGCYFTGMMVKHGMYTSDVQASLARKYRKHRKERRDHRKLEEERAASSSGRAGAQ